MLIINPAQEKFGGFLSRYVPVGIPVAIGCLPRAVMAILLGRKGPGWYRLPGRWYLKLRELFHVTRIMVNVLANMAVAFLPLRLTEPIMSALNPAMRRRPRMRGYKAEEFRASGWDNETARQKTAVLKSAQVARKTTGGFSIEPPVLAESRKE